MISYGVYKILHILGMAFVFIALGGITAHAVGGGDKGSNPASRTLAIAHGVGLVLMLVAGFGMLARIGGSPASGWVLGKLVIWLLLGAATMIPYRARSLGGLLLTLLPLFGALAAYLAIYKPF